MACNTLGLWVGGGGGGGEIPSFGFCLVLFLVFCHLIYYELYEICTL